MTTPMITPPTTPVITSSDTARPPSRRGIGASGPSTRRLVMIIAAIVLAVAVATVGGSATPASASNPQNRLATKFEAQADAAGLSKSEVSQLQHRVDAEIKRTDGHRVALNQVAWPGGDTLLPLPGERYAHELTATTTAAVSPHATSQPCYYLDFCLYQNRDFSGAIYRYKVCGTYELKDGGFGEHFTAYENNQTRGTRARFLDNNRKLVSYTYPAFHRGTTSLWGRTYYIRPC